MSKCVDYMCYECFKGVLVKLRYTREASLKNNNACRTNRNKNIRAFLFVYLFVLLN